MGYRASAAANPPEPGGRYIGVPVHRREDHDLLTGRAVMVADLDLPGTVELAFTRSPLAHADVRGVDASPARSRLPTSLEARAVLVRPEPGGGLTVWVSHQAQHRLRDGLAGAFGLDPAQVRVVVPAAGGAFGAKSQAYPEYVLAAQLARLLDRPVRWVEDRAEAIRGATRGRGQNQRVRLAAAEDGRLLGYELHVEADIGGYPQTGTWFRR